MPLIQCVARRGKNLGLCILGIAALLLGACGDNELEDRPRLGSDDGGFSVLLLVLDACRPDKLGSYGFERETSPTIDALARDPNSVIFLNHYVQASWTKPSTASLFTGRFVHEHGVMSEVKEADERSGRRYQSTVLSGSFKTLAEYLSDADFYTFGVAQAQHLFPQYGFSQGFDEYYDAGQVKGDKDRVRKTTALISAISGKFFGYVHLLACHVPYPPRLRDTDYMAKYGFEYDEHGRMEAGVDFTTGHIKNPIREGQVTLNDEDVKFLNLIYEAKLRWTDRQLVAPIIRALIDSERYDDTLIIVTADHGEELYEHRGYGHAQALWQEVIHVPMIVKYPDGEKPDGLGSEVAAVTSSVDIVPSILALVGIEAPKSIRAAPALTGVFNRYALAEDSTGLALIQDGHKLIENGTGTLLFDLEADPLERQSLTDDMPDRVAAMREFILQLKEGTVAHEAAIIEETLDEAAVDRLRSLGYIQ